MFGKGHGSILHWNQFGRIRFFVRPGPKECVDFSVCVIMWEIERPREDEHMMWFLQTWPTPSKWWGTTLILSRPRVGTIGGRKWWTSRTPSISWQKNNWCWSSSRGLLKRNRNFYGVHSGLMGSQNLNLNRIFSGNRTFSWCWWWLACAVLTCMTLNLLESFWTRWTLIRRHIDLYWRLYRYQMVHRISMDIFNVISNSK